MKPDGFVKTMLVVIVLLLGAIAARPIIFPEKTFAQASSSRECSCLYLDPAPATIFAPDGTAQLRGRIVVDMKSGNIWGFPVGTSLEPYPRDPTTSKPPVSNPIYLGRYNFDALGNAPAR